MVTTDLPRVGDTDLQRLTSLIEDALNALQSNPLNNAVVLPLQLVNTTDTRVYHGLGRVPIGFFPVRCAVSGVTVADGVTAETLDPFNYISLRASAGVAVSLAVF